MVVTPTKTIFGPAQNAAGTHQNTVNSIGNTRGSIRGILATLNPKFGDDHFIFMILIPDLGIEINGPL